MFCNYFFREILWKNNVVGTCLFLFPSFIFLATYYNQSKFFNSTPLSYTFECNQKEYANKTLKKKEYAYIIKLKVYWRIVLQLFLICVGLYASHILNIGLLPLSSVKAQNHFLNVHYFFIDLFVFSGSEQVGIQDFFLNKGLVSKIWPNFFIPKCLKKKKRTHGCTIQWLQHNFIY